MKAPDYRNVLPSKFWKAELTREGYGRTLVELGHSNPRVVVLDADLSQSTLTKYFAAEFPDRFFEMGISEQDMVNTAGGLSLMGFVPFLSSYAIFLTSRSLDQVRNTVDYTQLNVKIAAAHGGISVGRDGPSHQSMEDLSNMLVLPNMTVVVPADKPQAEAVTRWAADYVGPVYFRLGREKVPTITDGEGFFEHAKAQTIIEGEDGTIIACGLMVSEAIKAAESLAEEGVFPRVVNMATLKPLDTSAIDAVAQETGAVVTAEEHSIFGGLGSVVARHIVQSDRRVPTRIVGIPDIYLTSGAPEELLEVAGLTAQNIAAKLKEALGTK
jgi:transketolase